MRVRVALIIQARMASKRLPGKSIADLAGKPLLGRIIERIKRCQTLDYIILAIPAELSEMRAMYGSLTPIKENFSVHDIIGWYDHVK
jgi:spore coat polysaccharide biosynthesis protein SpsF (cytidylyltransferase family)